MGLSITTHHTFIVDRHLSEDIYRLLDEIRRLRCPASSPDLFNRRTLIRS